MKQGEQKMINEDRKQMIIDRVIETTLWFAIPPPKPPMAQMQRGSMDTKGLDDDELRYLASKMLQVQRLAVDFKNIYPPEKSLRMILEIVQKVDADTDVDAELLKIISNREMIQKSADEERRE